MLRMRLQSSSMPSVSASEWGSGAGSPNHDDRRSSVEGSTGCTSVVDSAPGEPVLMSGKASALRLMARSDDANSLLSLRGDVRDDKQELTRMVTGSRACRRARGSAVPPRQVLALLCRDPPHPLRLVLFQLSLFAVSSLHATQHTRILCDAQAHTLTHFPLSRLRLPLSFYALWLHCLPLSPLPFLSPSLRPSVHSSRSSSLSYADDHELMTMLEDETK
eukprot:3214196-Rhodomonas_salina.1